MNFNYAPKFHVLHENIPSVLQEMSVFFDMGEDAIERWHQMRTRHFARIRSLRSEEKQRLNAAKHEHTANDHDVNNIMSNVANETKKHFKKEESATLKIRKSQTKKELREAKRLEAKGEIEEEDRTTTLTSRERLKQEHKESHDV